jgi:hypothetical protein
MLKYRVEALARSKDGTIRILTTHHFEADSPADAERVADDWAKARRLAGSTADRLRVVRSDIIVAERRLGHKDWTR